MSNAKQDDRAGPAPGIVRACDDARKKAVRRRLALRKLSDRLEPDIWDVFVRAAANSTLDFLAEQAERDGPTIVERLRTAWDAMESLAADSCGDLREQAWALLESCARLQAFRAAVPEQKRKQAQSRATLVLFDALLKRAIDE